MMMVLFVTLAACMFTLATEICRPASFFFAKYSFTAFPPCLRECYRAPFMTLFDILPCYAVYALSAIGSLFAMPADGPLYDAY